MYACVYVMRKLMKIKLRKRQKKFTTESFIYPTDAQIDCSKNVEIYIKIDMRGAATCFGFSQPSSGSY
jgi:hypothetical protein